MGYITDNVHRILKEVPAGISVVAAAKKRTVPEVQEAIDAGISCIGENYLQESVEPIGSIGNKVSWHFIGRLQKNKARHVVPLFDMIETVDSAALAETIDVQAEKHDKIMPILIEINCARESQKSGVLPEDTEGLIQRIRTLDHIRVKGLMTMGPFFEDPEGLRPFFNETRGLFEDIRSLQMDNVDMEYLSMGMSESYLIAIEEGATLVRIGTKIFGPRTY